MESRKLYKKEKAEKNVKTLSVTVSKGEDNLGFEKGTESGKEQDADLGTEVTAQSDTPNKDDIKTKTSVEINGIKKEELQVQKTDEKKGASKEQQIGDFHFTCFCII